MRLTPSKYLAISAAWLLLAGSLEARTRPHYGGVLRIETRVAAIDSTQSRSLVGECLTRLDAQGRVLPLLADSWESQNGDRRWQFTIHGNISMHDGSPLTGKLIAQVLSSARVPPPWKSVSGSDTAVVFDSDVPIANLPALLASADFAITRRTPDGTLIGTGPFKVASLTSNLVSLQAVDDYWRGRPYVDRVEVVASRSVRNQWLDLSVGRTDVAEVPAELLRRAQQDRLHTAELTGGELVLVTVSPQLSDVVFRHAISASIDRTALASVIFQKQGQPASTLIPNSLTGYGVLFSSSYDLASARDLRSNATGVMPLTISYDPADATLQLVAERIALNARDAGISVQAVSEMVQPNALLHLRRVPLQTTDPAAALVERVRDLSEQVLLPAPNLGALYEQERGLIDQYQLIPLLHLPRAIAVSDRVRGAQAFHDDTDVSNVWVEERP